MNKEMIDIQEIWKDVFKAYENIYGDKKRIRVIFSMEPLTIKGEDIKYYGYCTKSTHKEYDLIIVVNLNLRIGALPDLLCHELAHTINLYSKDNRDHGSNFVKRYNKIFDEYVRIIKQNAEKDGTEIISGEMRND